MLKRVHVLRVRTILGLIILAVGVFLLVRPIIIRKQQYNKAIEKYNLLQEKEAKESDYIDLLDTFKKLSENTGTDSYYIKTLKAQGQYYYENGEYIKAYRTLKSAGCNESDNELMNQIAIKNANISLSVAEKGDIITLGRYEQDGNLENGYEDLDWVVLKENGTKKLIITKYCIEAIPYHMEAGKTSWADSFIKEWMDSILFEEIFNEREKNLVINVQLEDTYNSEYETWAEGTESKIFLLSVEELEKNLLNNSTANIFEWTKYMVNRGAATQCLGFWLRTPGIDYDGAVYAKTKYFEKGDGCVNYNFVRPAVWIDIKQLQDN